MKYLLFCLAIVFGFGCQSQNEMHEPTSSSEKKMITFNLSVPESFVIDIFGNSGNRLLNDEKPDPDKFSLPVQTSKIYTLKFVNTSTGDVAYETQIAYGDIHREKYELLSGTYDILIEPYYGNTKREDDNNILQSSLVCSGKKSNVVLDENISEPIVIEEYSTDFALILIYKDSPDETSAYMRIEKTDGNIVQFESAEDNYLWLRPNDNWFYKFVDADYVKKLEIRVLSKQYGDYETELENFEKGKAYIFNYNREKLSYSEFTMREITPWKYDFEEVYVD